MLTVVHFDAAVLFYITREFIDCSQVPGRGHRLGTSTTNESTLCSVRQDKCIVREPEWGTDVYL